MQLEGVLSTSQAAKSFMGTGFDALVILSDLFFSVILQRHCTHVSQHKHTISDRLHCYLITNCTRDPFSSNTMELTPINRQATQTQQCPINFSSAEQSEQPAKRMNTDVGRTNVGSIRLTDSGLVLLYLTDIIPLPILSIYYSPRVSRIFKGTNN